MWENVDKELSHAFSLGLLGRETYQTASGFWDKMFFVDVTPSQIAFNLGFSCHECGDAVFFWSRAPRLYLRVQVYGPRLDIVRVEENCLSHWFTEKVDYDLPVIVP